MTSPSSVVYITILPPFVSEGVGPTGTVFKCVCNACGRVGTNFGSLTAFEAHLNSTQHNKFFLCPVAGCNHRIPTLAGVITHHIRNAHKGLAKRLFVDGAKTAIHCRDCNDYTTRSHYHCYECANVGTTTFFLSKDERDDHLKTGHIKWFFEYPCKFGTRCHGRESGACGFNHHNDGKKFVIPEDELSSHICPDDQPWNEGRANRCSHLTCPKDHFWGRVRWQSKAHRHAKGVSAVSTSGAGVGVEDDGSHAEDDGSHAEDDGSHAEDDGSHAEDDRSHAEDDGCKSHHDAT